MCSSIILKEWVHRPQKKQVSLAKFAGKSTSKKRISIGVVGNILHLGEVKSGGAAVKLIRTSPVVNSINTKARMTS